MIIRLLEKYPLLRFQWIISGIVMLSLFPQNPGVITQHQQDILPIEARVGASSDDAEEHVNGNVTTEGDNLKLVLDRSNQTVGIRFNDIDIPQNAHITSAYVQFRAAGVNAEVTSLKIEGEASDDPPTFAPTYKNISSRPRTSASVSWLPQPWLMEGATGPNQQTPNIASIIQEIIVRPGWKSGNSLVILITGSGQRIADSYDGASHAAPLLHVEYTLTGNLNPTITVISPLNGSTFNQGDLVRFTGTATDLEDGDLTAGLTWTSSLDGSFGTGGTLSTSDLSAGKHMIEASVTDSAGLTDTVTTTVTVFENIPVLVAAGDIAYVGERDEETAKLLETIPGIIATIGDNVYEDGKLEEFNNYFEPTWGRHKARIRPAIGDHEYDVPGAYGYYRYFGDAAGEPGKGYYSYDLGDWHIIVLNSECERLRGCEVDSPQGQWLKADLASNGRICTLAYFHDPLFSSAAASVLPEIKGFWTLLYEAEVDVILNGHVHNYERFAPQDPEGRADPVRGIREFVVGTGGRSSSSFDAMPAPNSEVRIDGSAGVLKMTLHPTSYEWEFIPIAGKTFNDSGSADCASSSSIPKTPTAERTSTGVHRPTAELKTPTATPTGVNVLNVTATIVEIAGDIAGKRFRSVLPVFVILLVPLLAYLLFFFRRSHR